MITKSQENAFPIRFSDHYEAAAHTGHRGNRRKSASRKDTDDIS